jgi:chaperonin GroES
MNFSNNENHQKQELIGVYLQSIENLNFQYNEQVIPLKEVIDPIKLYNKLNPNSMEKMTLIQPTKVEVPEGFPVPLGSTVFIFMKSFEQKTKDGIIIPESNKSVTNTGVIMAVGPECKRGLLPGHRVIYNAYADQEIIYSSHAYKMMNEIDVFAILPESAIAATSTLSEAQRISLRRPDINFDEHGTQIP